MTTLHISQIGSLIALNLARVELHNDEYHQNIARAARQMVANGYGGWEYLCQYASGTTDWKSKGHVMSIGVSRV